MCVCVCARWKKKRSFLLFHYRAVDLHAEKKAHARRAHTFSHHVRFESLECLLSLPPYFSILIHHWPDMGMLSLSPHLSLAPSLTLLHTASKLKIKGEAGRKQTPQQGELYPER